MSCASCSNNNHTGESAGCKNNGTCVKDGCSMLTVYDWLADIELPAGQPKFNCIEVRFKNSRKNFYRNSKDLNISVGDLVVVEGSPGHDVGVVTLTGELVKTQMNKGKANFDSHEIRKLYRKAEEADITLWHEARAMEKETMYKARTYAIEHDLVMKISDVEYQGDKKKATFYYTADGRVDFRELIKTMADAFKIRIEMRQIGARQESGRLGGIGPCGRELCCSTWLTDFRSVGTSAARYQQLSLNPQKLAGQCGKLKCCLNYELDMYLEAFKEFPKNNIKLKTKKGEASNVKTDIFKKLMWYVYEGEQGAVPIPLAVNRVREIIEMNKSGNKPDDLRSYMEVVIDETPDYANVDDQDSLTRFDEKFKKGRRKKGNKRNKNKKHRKPHSHKKG